MAFLKPNEEEAAAEVIEGEAALLETIIEEPATESVPAKPAASEKAECGHNTAAAGRTVVLDVSVHAVNPKPGKKKAAALENQISLFDFLDTLSA